MNYNQKKKKKILWRKFISIPKNGCNIPFLVKIFSELANSGILSSDVGDTMRAVNITSKAIKDFDEGLQWNKDVFIAEDLKLKLYKAGLKLLYLK